MEPSLPFPPPYVEAVPRPHSLQRPCAEPGCPALAEPGDRYCAIHKIPEYRRKPS